MEIANNFFNFKLKRSPATAIMLSVLLSFCMVTASCNAAWLPKVEGYINAFLPVAGQVAQLVLLLSGTGISAQQSAEINNDFAQVQGDIKLLETLAETYANAPTGQKASILTQINALIQGVSDHLAAILPAFHVTNPASVDKVNKAVGLLLVAVQDIVKNIPGATPVNLNPAGASAVTAARQVTIRRVSSSGKTSAAAPLGTVKSGDDLKVAWNSLMQTTSGDPAVDAASSKVLVR